MLNICEFLKGLCIIHLVFMRRLHVQSAEICRICFNLECSSFIGILPFVPKHLYSLGFEISSLF